MKVLLLIGTVLAMVGCTTSIPQPRQGGSEQAAEALVALSAAAQGWEQLSEAGQVRVRLEGDGWAWLVSRVQPVLVDKAFRGDSDEWYAVEDDRVEQIFVGEGGVKVVSRDGDDVRVWYNGQESTDDEVCDAAALVADNYRMFLLGPGFFLQRGAAVQLLGTEKVDGLLCDNVLAVLRPGLGNSEEDRVVLSIDRERHWLRRLRITVDGLESTRGAVADIALRGQVNFGGVVVPTRFEERLKKPFPAAVHEWRLVGIDFGEGAARMNPAPAVTTKDVEPQMHTDAHRSDRE